MPRFALVLVILLLAAPLTAQNTPIEVAQVERTDTTGWYPWEFQLYNPALDEINRHAPGGTAGRANGRWLPRHHARGQDALDLADVGVVRANVSSTENERTPA